MLHVGDGVGVQNHGLLPPGGNPQHLTNPGVLPQQMAEVLTPKKQAVERLRRRIENYRRRQTDYMPRFDRTFNVFCEQNVQDTLVLKQKFLENKAKRTAKKQDKKQSEPGSNIQNNLLAQQKFLKRTADDLDVAPEYGDPAPKIQCGAAGGGKGGGGRGSANTPPSGGPAGGGGGAARSTETLTKFSVEIVQQLEFTTSAASSQPQQISTNVTVKALTNASVKSDMGGMNSPKPGQESSPVGQNLSGQTQRTAWNCVDLGNLVECKQEPDSEFVDLEQCAAALEKDAQNNGASFPGFSEFIGDEGGDEIITSDAFKVLISEISDFNPEFMKDFDFDEQKPNVNANSICGDNHNIVSSITATGHMKVESDNKDNVQIHHQNMMDLGKSPLGNQYSPGQYDLNTLGKARMGHYPGLEFGKAELSPAAQTLKQMAEQHQHKTQPGMNYAGNRNPRSPYGDYPLNSNNEYINSPGSTNTPPGAPQYINKRGQGPGPGGPFGGPGPGSTPPRPPSVSAGTTLQMSQQMQVNQQTSGQQIQVSAGQHMQLTGDLKSNVTVAAQQQQGLFYSQQSDTYTVSQSQTINFTQQSLRGRGPGTVARPEQPHKFMQQQPCILRAQQQQQPPPPMGIRPPPPEYKSSQPQMIHSLPPQRFTAATIRRPGPGQQPMPPSGPMMRPQHTAGSSVYMGSGGMPRGWPCGYTLNPRQRPPNVSVGPDGMPIGNRGNAEWKHILMSQQQSVGFGHARPFNTHQGVNPHIHQQYSNNSGFTSAANNTYVNSSGSPVTSITQSATSNGTNISSNNSNNNNHNSNSSNNNSSSNSSGNGCGSSSVNSNSGLNNNLATNDFGFEFLESLPGDPPFSAQDLISSLDSTSNFNLNDIL